MPEPVLELEGVEVRYGTVAAVRRLALRLDAGEIVGLIGPNGAGKSTTLHAIMGVVPTHAGEIRLRGRSIRRRTPEAIAHEGVALVPEGRRIFGDFTVEENLRLGLAGRRRGANGGDPLDHAYDLFPMLREYRRRQAGVLSGGQQQQLPRSRAPRGRERLRGAAPDPRPRGDDPARRAARHPHRRVGRQDARARRRGASPCPHAGGRARPGQDRRRLPRLVPQ
jgi:branched-chain amino acid transport system ATP-binding protein